MVFRFLSVFAALKNLEMKMNRYCAVFLLRTFVFAVPVSKMATINAIGITVVPLPNSGDDAALLTGIFQMFPA